MQRATVEPSDGKELAEGEDSVYGVFVELESGVVVAQVLAPLCLQFTDVLGFGVIRSVDVMSLGVHRAGWMCRET